MLVVQGGPGTGKTAVALHRAAYLLYTHRFPLERQGVLVVGPNPLFLRYIEQVLPSLGETGVSLSTVAGLVPEVRVRGRRRPRGGQAEGRRAHGQGARAGRADPPAPAPPRRRDPLRCRRPAPAGRRPTEEIVALARRRPGTHNARRRFVEAQVLRALADELPGPARPAAAGVDGRLDEGPDAPEEQSTTWPGGSGATPEVADALDRMWPRLSPHELLHDLLGARPLLAAAGKGILSPAEMRCLVPAAERALDEVPWTAADAALIDEARTLLGPRRRARRRPRAERRRARERARRAGSGPRGWRRRRSRPRGAAPAPRTRSVPSATSWSTRCRTSRPCSCACWPAARCPAR